MNTKTDHAVTAEEFNKIYMSDKFDCSAVWDTEIRPLIEQANKLCEEHGMPFYSVAVISNDDDKFNTAQSIHFNGPERTPINLVAIKRLMTELDDEDAETVMRFIADLARARRAEAGRPN